jgi:hypothetical protein
MSTTEEPLGRKSSDRGHADHVAPPDPQKLALTSPTSGVCSVGIVRSRTQATDFTFCLCRNIFGNFLLDEELISDIGVYTKS